MPQPCAFRFLLGFVCFGLLSSVVAAQEPPSYDLPDTGTNTRFFRDQFVAYRPSLTFNGFSCLSTDTCDFGLGITEVIESLRDPKADVRTRTYAKQIREWSLREIVKSPVTRFQVIDNSRVLQARGLLSILSLVAEVNNLPIELLEIGPVTGEGTGRTASATLQSFLQAMALREAYRINRNMTDDGVKWVAPLGNLARSLDLFLAIELAVQSYPSHRFDVRLPLLPSCEQKADFLTFVAEQTDQLDDLGNEPVFLGIKRDEIQPGNWPMKVHVAVAYASLAQQMNSAASCISVPDHPFTRWLERGIRSAGAPTNQNRSKHWNYQTDSGRRFFAEGPYYFHLTLTEIIPFWHAVRINHLLDFHPEFSLDNPFRAAWFVEPLSWLADTVAPNGDILPLDDGNRVYMSNADLLRWDASYGDARLGLNFAWISDQRTSDSFSNPNFLGLFLAIPRVKSGEGVRPARSIGGVLSLGGPRTEEQVALVRRSGQSTGRVTEHLIALNGEYGDAIVRGEGHEQADQLQLIYYVDDVSVLMDSGYDNASGVTNSSWNHYYDHNVLTIFDGLHQRDGGLPPPNPDVFSFRIVSDHAPAEFLGQIESGRIDVLRGEVLLGLGNAIDSAPIARYTRNVLIVGDPSDPYLIDINRGTSQDDHLFFRMSYHPGGQFITKIGSSYRWRLSTGNGSSLETHIYPFRIDGQVDIQIQEDTGMERFGVEESIDRLDLVAPSPTRLFTSVTYISTGDEGRPDSGPFRAPVESEGSKGELTAWIYRKGIGTVDILVTAFNTDSSLRGLIDLDGTLVRLVLDSNAEFGFVRLTKQSTGTWRQELDYSFQLSVGSVSVGTASSASEYHAPSIVISPNPVRAEAQIEFNISQGEQVRLAVYDVQGREVDVIADTYRIPGRHKQRWRPGTLADGMYLLVQSSVTGRQVTSFIVQ